MSTPASSGLSTPLPTFVAEIYQVYARGFREEFIMLGLLLGLYGVLTILSLISCYALLTQSNSRSRPAVTILSLTVFALFASTTIYMVASILNYQANVLHSFAVGGGLFWSYGYDIPPAFDIPPGSIEGYTVFQSCTSSATLTINVLLGDAIVCWRTCVIWNQNRAVKAICGVFLLATLVFGAVDTTQSCQLARLDSPNYIDLNVLGTLFEGVPIGIAACALSLSINVLTTLLVAYKALQSRRRLKHYFGKMSRTSQVQMILSLLIESGTVYSALWAVVVAYQAENSYLSGRSSWLIRFLDVSEVIANDTLIPAIAIYPTIIIVFVALNKSHMEKGLTQHLESLPTPHITLAVDGIAVSHRDERNAEESVAMDEEAFTRRNTNYLEDANRSVGEGPKVEGIV